ncbi:MAG: cation:proton antiporter [Planctomycetes bacterium]|nr:cation:proton antiporter [Planctomycetota bacterium]
MLFALALSHSFGNAVLEGAQPLFVFALVLVTGLLFGALAKKAKLPKVTGQILAGVLVGDAGLALFPHDAIVALEPLTKFALALMAVTVGSHLSFRRLRNARRRLTWLVLFEASLPPLIVFGLITQLTSTPLGIAALFAVCTVDTAPATTVALVAESRARGVFVKTLVAAVALNNMAAIFLFEATRAVLHARVEDVAGVARQLGGPTTELVLAAVVGGGIGFVLHGLDRLYKKGDLPTAAALVALALTSGLAEWLGASSILSCMFLGIVQTNLNRERGKVVDAVFSEFQPAILAIFFTLAGMHVSLEHAAAAGLLAVLVFAGRASGKILAGNLAMRIAGAPERLQRYLGMALVPQAGVAVALVLIVQSDPFFAAQAEMFSAVVLTVVTANEVFGPILTRLALVRSGDAGKDRDRLLDFIQEENIVIGLRATTKEGAIRKLVDAMATSHHLTAEERETLLESTLQREREASTCFGNGLAVPHGIVPDTLGMVGVIGLSSDGLTFDTPDGEPVHCMVLLGTPEADRARHLQVLATLARTIGHDAAFRADLFHAGTAAHASELLHGDESQAFNRFLDED